MKKITVGPAYGYFPEGKTVSRSFKSKIAEYMTNFLESVIVDDKHKTRFTKVLDIDFGNPFMDAKYDETFPNMMLYQVSSKYAYIMATSIVYWESSDGYKEPIYPWSDVSEVDISFKSSLSDRDIKSINLFLDETYNYVCRSKESGLGYDYEIRGDLSEGNLVFSFKQKPTTNELQLLEKTLFNWFDAYNKSNDFKINYIGDLTIKNGRAYAYIDGIMNVDMLKECFESFRDCSFIKRITFKE